MSNSTKQSTTKQQFSSVLKSQLYWSSLPFIFSIILAFLLFNRSLTFDFFSFKLNHPIIYKVFIYLIIASPLLFLYFSKYWKNQKTHKKLLLASLVILFSGINFKVQHAFQFSFLFMISTLIYYYFERKTYRPNIFYLLLIAYFLIEAISLLWSYNATQGIIYLSKLSPLFIFPLLFSFFKLEKRDFDLVAIAFFRFSMFLIFISLAAWILQSRFLDFSLLKSLTFHKYAISKYFCYEVVFSWSVFKHPTYYSIFLIFSISLGWYYTFKRNIENNITIFEFAFFILSTLLLSIITASRIMLVGVMVVSVIGFLYSIRTNKKIFIASVSFFVISFFSIVSNFSDKIAGFLNDPIRVCFQKVALESIKENTWLGTGLGGMTKYLNAENPIIVPLQISKEGFVHFHPHNQFLGDLMQTGVLGILTIFLILGTVFFYGFKQKNWLLLMNGFFMLLVMNIEMPLMYINGIFLFALIFSFLTNRGKLG